MSLPGTTSGSKSRVDRPHGRGPDRTSADPTPTTLALRLHTRNEDAISRPSILEETDQAEIVRARELHRFDRRAPKLRLINDVATTLAPVASALGRAGRIADRVAEAIGPARFQRYFADQACIECDEHVVRVSAPTPAMAGLLDRRFGDALRAAAAAEFGVVGSATLVVFIAEPSKFKSAPDELARTPSPSRPTPSPLPRSVTVASPVGGATASGRVYRLEDYVVGDSNRLAYNAALQLADAAGETDSRTGAPMLFLHGPCGVGKTHLLQGLAQRHRELHPGSTVRVTTGESFMNDFVQAIRAGGGTPMTGHARASSGGGGGGSAGGGGGVERFRRQYRRCDLLCIDDVHFLASKQATQQELLHTFDEISLSGARIALVCDQHPRAIKQFSPALVSRFMAGMVAAIEPPDGFVRERAIRLLAIRRALLLDDSAVRLLVERTRTLPGGPMIGLREIEGLVTRVQAIHTLLPSQGHPGGAIGVLAIERALGDAHGRGSGSETNSTDAIGPRIRRPVRIETIIAQTCTALGVDAPDLGAPTRHKRVVLARAIVTHLARELTTMSFPEIARAIGRPSHSTVITAHQRLAKQILAGETFGIGPDGEAMTVGGLVNHLAATLARK